MIERIDQARASILHQRPYRESSLLVEIFSRDHGRVGLIANGARRPKSRLRALLQPMQELSLSWQTRGELGTLRAAEAPTVPATPQGDALFAGFYMNELLMRLCVRGDPHPELYDSYRHAVDALTQASAPAVVLRLFERDLLESIGYGLQLTHEADHAAAVEAQYDYLYDPQHGPQRIVEGQSTDKAVSGAALLALHSGLLEDEQLRREAKRILQTALNRLLDQRPLRTVQALRRMRQRDRLQAGH